MPFFGCVADDFTGASDAASFLVKGGLSVQLFNGIPKEDIRVADGVQAIVIALKSRTQEKNAAVADSLRALRCLGTMGVKQFYLKYCSTFDSTPNGNIGPIADAAMELLGVPYTILCPALPVNGRVVIQGELYVNGIPLHESPMKNHPLTPMWDSRITNLMRPQSRYTCMELWKEQMGESDKNIWSMLERRAWEKKPYYIIPDYQNQEDGDRIVGLFGNLKLLTGGSGLLEALSKRVSKMENPPKDLELRVPGGAIMLAGSCSKATLGQISYFRDLGGLCRRIDPAAMLEGKETLEDVWRFVEENPGVPVLLYSSDTAQNVKEFQKLGSSQIAAMLEDTAAELAKRAVGYGIRRIIVAGGETSGAVTKNLGFSSYQIGASVAPGVPVMIPTENPEIRLILKSGNFGQADFFEKALQMTQMEEM